jgi:hypothetical protein
VLPVVVVGPGMHSVTHKTLCFTSAPREPSALMVSLTWKPWLGRARQRGVVDLDRGVVPGRVRRRRRPRGPGREHRGRRQRDGDRDPGELASLRDGTVTSRELGSGLSTWMRRLWQSRPVRQEELRAAESATDRPEAAGCNPSGRPLVPSGEPGHFGLLVWSLRRRHGDAAGAEVHRRAQTSALGMGGGLRV